MRRLLIIMIASYMSASCHKSNESVIRINQLGYRPDDIKIAVLISRKEAGLSSFNVVDAATGKTVLIKNNLTESGGIEPFKSCFRLDFSELKTEGKFRIEAGKTISPDFVIAEDIYDGLADFLLKYMRQQRCGFNPWLKDSCHTHDGYIIYGGDSDSTHIDVTGGWHDAADYLQYVATSANATYQMCYAYLKNPSSFSDEYLANGLPGRNGTPDVIDEAKWGLEWLLKMNPSPGVMFNQIADDRDHIGFRYPDKDTANYGKGRERPVYMCTGKPQGLFKYRNRATGISSTAGKFASAFAIGAEVYSSIDPDFSKLLLSKAISAFNYGLENPGACQTAPGTAPYFYEEDNWSDDMELAASQLYHITNNEVYLRRAIEFGRMEIVTPWMGADTARHYQWYPFVNMGHPGLAGLDSTPEIRHEFLKYMKEGLQRVKERGEKNPFMIGIPFIWCSNNLVAATLTQASLYSGISGDDTYREMEASLRDWLFGCNPWGTSMVVGIPEKGDYPENSHSSYVVKGEQVPGGLVDGPVYQTIFKNLKGLYLSEEDEYSGFQTDLAVYHDDYADYSTNECTMDGTACLVYYLSSLQSRPKR